MAMIKKAFLQGGEGSSLQHVFSGHRPEERNIGRYGRSGRHEKGGEYMSIGSRVRSTSITVEGNALSMQIFVRLRYKSLDHLLAAMTEQ